MAVPPNIDVLDDILLDAWYDPGAVARGRAYAREDRVRLLGASPGSIKAACEGSARASYVVGVRWSRSGGRIEIADSCTCPIGGGCKHCVATIITARRQAQQARQGLAGGRAPAGTPDWRRMLAELATSDDVPDRDDALALQVAVATPRSSRWAPSTEPYLTIRPLRRGRAGSWVKTGATWRDVGSPYTSELDAADQLQRSALRTLMSASTVDLRYATENAAPLAQFGPEVWHHLERAVEVGVELVGERAGDLVELAPTRARAELDLAAGPAGTVAVTAGFARDGHPLELDAGRVGLIGSPPHGLWVAELSRLQLVPLDVPLHPVVARLATSGGLTVPARDVDEFLDTYQPALARHAAVGSSDGTVAITTSRFEQLVLVVHRTAIDEAVAIWVARYRRGERTTDHPLHQPAGRSRDRAAEAAAARAIELPTHLLAQLAGPGGGPEDLRVTGPSLLALLTEVVPWLEARGEVAVEVTGDLPALREATEDPLISLTVTDPGDERSGNDWFDLGVEVSIDGEVIDFASLFTALHRGEATLILPSGTWLRLDRPELDALRELIDEAVGLAEPGANGVARVNRFQTSWWDELAGLGVVATQSARWADAVASMAGLTAPTPVPVPEGLDAVLRPYQQEGLDWLAFLHRNRLGGILADDMGLGKTIQTLALFLHVLEEAPEARFLVVAPTSVVENWAREASRFAPGLAVCAIRETASRRGTALEEEIGDARLVITSYALFRLEFDAYDQLGWDLLLLDEAQFVKNHQGKTYQCVRRLDAATKIALTGTPLENTLMDLWALLSITAPGLYPDPKRFSATYRTPIESGEAPELLATLRRRIAPLLRRRTKDEVLTELPPKTEQVVEVELSARHARIYQTQLQRQRQKVLGLVGDVQKHRFEILKSLTILRQLALDPGLIDEEHAAVGSAKLDRLLDDLTQIVAEGHRALVFSQFTRFLALLRERLDAAGIEHTYLDGRTRKRAEAIARFKDREVPVFVISLKAGGFGLNLAEADYCFVLDPWWNPATENQAVDRAHRMGQENPVMVYRYVSAGTIEEKVMELKARKADLFANVLDAEGALSGALGEDDIRGLLDLG